MYSIYQALESIKEELEGYEKEMKGMSAYSKDFQKTKMLWCFERGIGILKIAKPGELTEETYDWFLGRTAKKPYDSQRQALEKIRKANINGNWFDRFYRLR